MNSDVTHYFMFPSQLLWLKKMFLRKISKVKINGMKRLPCDHLQIFVCIRVIIRENILREISGYLPFIFVSVHLINFSRQDWSALAGNRAFSLLFSVVVFFFFFHFTFSILSSFLLHMSSWPHPRIDICQSFSTLSQLSRLFLHYF